MADMQTDRELLTEVQTGVEAMARLAEDEETFRAAVDAFRARDGESLRLLLERHELVERCQEICHWLRSKECVLLCLELAGPPPLAGGDQLEIREFAEAVGRVTADEELVELVATAVQERDGDAWRELIERHGLQRVSHLLCHWACTVHYRLVCDVVCTPGTARRSHLIPALQVAGEAIGRLGADREALASAVAAVEANDCVRLGGILAGAGYAPHCRVICEWFCGWRCMLVCLRLCRIFPLEELASPVGEMLAFARAGGRLAAEQGVSARLAAAVLREDLETVEGLVREHEFGPYCLQFCHWVCFLRCQRFCVCVCPPVDTIPLFTDVGIYRVDPWYDSASLTWKHDFQADGTTTVGGLAFTGNIPLRGILPDGLAIEATEYRFRVARIQPATDPPVLDPVQDVFGPLAAATKIGKLEYRYWDLLTTTWKTGSATYWVNNPGAVATIPQQFGPAITHPVNVTMKPGGWIEVPRENDLTDGGVGRFVRSEEDLLNLVTTALTDESFDLRIPAPGLRAGDSVPGAAHSKAPTYRIFFEARIVGGASVSANQLDRIALSNTHYTYARHPEWAGGDVTTTAVCSLDIGELIGPGATGCERLQNELHALFTTYHPYLGAVGVSIEGNPPIPAAIAPAVAGGEADSEPGGHLFDISALKPCAYILWLSVSLRLTDGWSFFGTSESDHIAFCKGKARIAGAAAR